MSPLATGYAVTAAATSALLLLAWRRPRAGRWAYAALFVGASLFNAATALRTPEVYVEGFAPLAFPPMRQLLELVIALAPGPIVLAIAAGQLAAGIGLAIGRGLPLRLGAAGAATFLAGLSWLGAGAAFPLNLALAAGALLLLRAPRR